ncbi:uncharacterized protein METZ01_LOCUS225980 [marine metagenome]|uniref:Uncharacterized protein n=1 Tax=marine metagenome TaxID=408172 RepID=A0A382GD11_9ZZZZ
MATVVTEIVVEIKIGRGEARTK